MRVAKSFAVESKQKEDLGMLWQFHNTLEYFQLFILSGKNEHVGGELYYWPMDIKFTKMLQYRR